MLDCYNIILERGDFTAAFDLHIQEGSLMSLLGPSGAGKSSILQCLAGLLMPKQGKIEFKGKDITHIPPQERNACMVFQGYALFPHLTVSANIAYGLRMHKYNKAKIEGRVGYLMELLKIQPLADANINDISGGEQQRVALARALAPDPDILLLDEPLAALDRQLRLTLRSEICAIQRNSNLTVVYVTHDQEEAFAISDSIALINKGKIEQVGSPADLYNYPANAFVASFLGGCLLLDGYYENHQLQTVLGILHTKSSKKSGKTTVCVRPEDIIINKVDAKWSQKNCFTGTVIDRQFMGSHSIIYLRHRSAHEQIIIPIQIPKHSKVKISDSIKFSIPENAVYCITGTR